MSLPPLRVTTLDGKWTWREVPYPISMYPEGSEQILNEQSQAGRAWPAGSGKGEPAAIRSFAHSLHAARLELAALKKSPWKTDGWNDEPASGATVLIWAKSRLFTIRSYAGSWQTDEGTALGSEDIDRWMEVPEHEED